MKDEARNLAAGFLTWMVRIGRMMFCELPTANCQLDLRAATDFYHEGHLAANFNHETHVATGKHMKAWLHVQEGRTFLFPVLRDSGTGKSPLLYLDGFNLTQYTLFDLDLTADDTEVVPPQGLESPRAFNPTSNAQRLRTYI